MTYAPAAESKRASTGRATGPTSLACWKAPTDVADAGNAKRASISQYGRIMRASLASPRNPGTRGIVVRLSGRVARSSRVDGDPHDHVRVQDHPAAVQTQPVPDGRARDPGRAQCRSAAELEIVPARSALDDLGALGRHDRHP